MLFAAYALTGPGHSLFSDGYISFLTARSILLQSTLAIEALPSGAITRGIDGRHYGNFGLGAALAFVPPLAVARIVPAMIQPSALEGPLDSLRRDEFWASFVNPALMAGVVAMILLCGVELGFSPREALAVSFAVAFGSPLWLYARIDASEALQGLGIVASFYFLLAARERAEPSRLLGAGGMLGVAILAKPTNVLLVPVFCGLAVSYRTGSRARLESVARFLAPVALAVAAVGVYDAVRFGSPFRMGLALSARLFTTPLLEGAGNVLWSPTYGLLFFWPAFVLTAAGVATFARRLPAELATIALSFGVMLFLYGRYVAYWGACWAPRYLVPFIPLLSLLLLPVAAAGARLRGALVVAMVLGAGVQSVAVLTSYVHQVGAVWRNVERGHSTPVHLDARIASLRVGAWWLRQTLFEHTGRRDLADAELASPPWKSVFPWTRGAAALPRLAGLRGVDLWVAPRGWKMPYFRYWEESDASRSLPSNGPLAALLLAVQIAAAWSLRAAWRDAAPAACTPPPDTSRRRR